MNYVHVYLTLFKQSDPNITWKDTYKDYHGLKL